MFDITCIVKNEKNENIQSINQPFKLFIVNLFVAIV